jgi:transposase-like protein
MKKQYTSSFKAKLVLELLKEQKSLSELASLNSIHPNQLRQWRDIALSQISTLFERKSRETDLIQEHEAEKEELYAEIGRLSTQLAWLKKKSGITIDTR